MMNKASMVFGASLFYSLFYGQAWGTEESSSTTFVSSEEKFLHPQPNLMSGPLFPGILGQVMADFDNDGDLDLFVTNSEGLPNYLYLNDGQGRFYDVAQEASVDLIDSYSVSAGLGDFDNDGLLDLLIGRQSNSEGGDSHPLLLKNMGLNKNGVPVFADISDESGISTLTENTKALGFAVADYNRDGALDIYIGAFDLTHSGDALLSVGVSDPNVLLMNTGVKGKVPTFTDHTDSAGVAGVKVAGRTPETKDQLWYPHTWAVYSSDVDVNGFMDIIVMNEAPGVVEIYLNQGNGQFQLMENEWLGKAGGWMGLASADFNIDGHLDYFITNLGAEFLNFGVPSTINLGATVSEGGQPYHYFLSGTDSGDLVDIAPDLNIAVDPTLPPNAYGLEPGLRAYDFGWGATFFDADNDGYKDLYWVGAHWPDIPVNGVSRFLLNNDGDSFIEETSSANLFNIPEDAAIDFENAHNGYSVLSGDIDNDGDDDLVVVNGSDTGADVAPGGIRIFKNVSENQNRQIKVSLKSRQGNSFGVGARVELFSFSLGNAATMRDLVAALADNELASFIMDNYTHRQVAEVVTTTSSFSATQPMVSFGLGSDRALELIKVNWPDGTVSQRLVPRHQSNLTLVRPRAKDR